MRRADFAFIVAVVLCLCSCADNCNAGSTGNKSESVRIMTWNLETFFDATADGNEYSEFRRKSSEWSAEKYNERLERLASVIKSVDADVVVMQELEKKEQIADIFNKLCGTFNFSTLYKYGAFAKEKDAAIGCAVISRFPIKEFTVHRIDVRNGKTSQPELRPIMETVISVKDSDFCLLVNHWKSKSGGAELSEEWRLYQERVLARRIMKKTEQKIPVVACGDFNKNIDEFETLVCEDGKICVVMKNSDKHVLLSSPWLENNGVLSVPGSYYYKGQWEYIDHFFTAGRMSARNFKVENDGPWASEDGTPFRYYLKAGTGYSDHFPISCTLEFRS